MAIETAARLGFRTVEREYTGAELAVEGTIPDWLTGTLVRNGPGKFEAGGEPVAHWFDGLAMLTGYRFGPDGSVTYTNRFLRTEAYRDAVERGRMQAQFASGGGSYLRRVWDLLRGRSTDNTNVHVAGMGGTTLALTEVPRYVEFDPETLETKGHFHFDDDLSGTVHCAHAIPDPHRGETVGLLTEYGRQHRYRLFTLADRSRKREELAVLPVDKPAYLHSFGLSERYVVLAEHPFRVNPLRFLLPGGDGFVDYFDWTPEEGTTFHVFDRETGDRVTQTTTEAFFVFHHVNAFDVVADGDGGPAVVVDLVSYPDDAVLSGLYLGGLEQWFESGVTGQLRRFRVPIGDGEVTSEHLYDGMELPRVAAEDRTRRHRFVYAQGAAVDDRNHVAKVDCETGETWRWDESGVFVEEPLFVRRRGGATPGDDGVVLVTALNTDEARTELLVLDGERLDELARAPLPHAIPFGFHGRFFPDD